jgi:hypothetical protein
LKSSTGNFTFKAVGEGTDGSRLRFVGNAHLTVNGTGDLAVELVELVKLRTSSVTTR